MPVPFPGGDPARVGEVATLLGFWDYVEVLVLGCIPLLGGC